MGKKEDILNLINQLGGSASSSDEDSGAGKRLSDADAERQHRIMNLKFEESKTFEVGDKIVLNELGKRKYRSPYAGQYAVIREIRDMYECSSDESFGWNAIVTIVMSERATGNACVDLAMFDKL